MRDVLPRSNLSLETKHEYLQKLLGARSRDTEGQNVRMRNELAVEPRIRVSDFVEFQDAQAASEAFLVVGWNGAYLNRGES